MSIISINLVWKIENGNFLTGKYSNQHDIIFNSNTTVKGTDLRQIGMAMS